MKKESPNKYRVRKGQFATPDSYVMAGMFLIPHYKIALYHFRCMVSDGIDFGIGWQHVSVSLVKEAGPKIIDVERCPTWEEMCFIKDQFWNDDEVVVQIHPAKKDYVNQHKYCLHLWKNNQSEFETPPSNLVGINQ